MLKVQKKEDVQEEDVLVVQKQEEYVLEQITAAQSIPIF